MGEKEKLVAAQNYVRFESEQVLEYAHSRMWVVVFFCFCFLALYPLVHHPEGCDLFPGVRTATFPGVRLRSLPVSVLSRVGSAENINKEGRDPESNALTTRPWCDVHLFNN